MRASISPDRKLTYDLCCYLPNGIWGLYYRVGANPKFREAYVMRKIAETKHVGHQQGDVIKGPVEAWLRGEYDGGFVVEVLFYPRQCDHIFIYLPFCDPLFDDDAYVWLEKDDVYTRPGPETHVKPHTHLNNGSDIQVHCYSESEKWCWCWKNGVIVSELQDGWYMVDVEGKRQEFHKTNFRLC